MDKFIYHIKDKKNLCGTVSDNTIFKNTRTIENIQEIINENTKFIKLCKKCKSAMIKLESKNNIKKKEK